MIRTGRIEANVALPDIRLKQRCHLRVYARWGAVGMEAEVCGLTL